MTLLQGLSEVKIGIHKSSTDSTVAPADIYTLDNSNGGPTGFNLQNLSAGVTKVYGGDGAYLTLSAGTGDVQATFNALDIPGELSARLLGYKQDEVSGAWLHGKDSTPLYASIMAVSHDKDGNEALMGLFRGTFTQGDINPQTNNASIQNTTDSLVFHAVNNKQGFTFAQGVVGENEVTRDKFETLLFGTASNA